MGSLEHEKRQLCGLTVRITVAFSQQKEALAAIERSRVETCRIRVVSAHSIYISNGVELNSSL